MATSLTYTSLVSRVKRFVERGATGQDPNFEVELPWLINDAERDLAVELKVLGFTRFVTGVMTAGVPVYPKPARWKQTASINYGVGASMNERTFLLPRLYEFVRLYWPDQTIQGAPEVYADYNYTNFIFAPTPDAGYPFEIAYYQELQLLDAANQTNWLTDNEPTLLLVATLLKAAPYLKNDPRIPTWQAFYDRRLLALTAQDVDRQTDRGSERGNKT